MILLTLCLMGQWSWDGLSGAKPVAPVPSEAELLRAANSDHIRLIQRQQATITDLEIEVKRLRAREAVRATPPESEATLAYEMAIRAGCPESQARAVEANVRKLRR